MDYDQFEYKSGGDKKGCSRNKINNLDSILTKTNSNVCLQ